MQTENIRKYLRPPEHGGAYSDQSLAGLLALTESGKLGWNSCCCPAAIPNAPHPLQAAQPYGMRENCEGDAHYQEALRDHPLAIYVDNWFRYCGHTDEERRAVLYPLIIAETKLRDRERLLERAAETIVDSANASRTEVRIERPELS